VIAQLMGEKMIYFVTTKITRSNISIKVLILHECFTVNENETSIPFYGENSTGLFHEAFRINKIITNAIIRFFILDQSVSKLNTITKRST
jgi:hypothetical protein